MKPSNHDSHAEDRCSDIYLQPQQWIMSANKSRKFQSTNKQPSFFTRLMHGFIGEIKKGVLHEGVCGGWVEVQRHSFMTLALHGGVRPASTRSPPPPPSRFPETHETGGLVGPRGGLNIFVWGYRFIWKHIFFSFRCSNSRTSGEQECHFQYPVTERSCCKTTGISKLQ